MKLRDLALPMALLVMLHCGAGIWDVKTGPGTSYPCGVSGVQCPGGGCCNADTEECGGPIPNSPQTCPTGYCCATGGNNTFGSSRERMMHLQWTPVPK
jgi:hypothetical protein